MAFTVESTAFGNGERIPHRYARDGDNVSPPLTWRDPPEGTESFLLVVDDPDAPPGTFHHWVVSDISADVDQLPEDATIGADGVPFRQFRNDFGNRGYDGPQPPAGDKPHNYHFRLLALDIKRLDADPTGSFDDIIRAATPHMITEAETVGKYQAA